MKLKTTIAAIATFGGLATGAMGQGLLNIGGVDVDSDLDLTTTVGFGGGYDHIKYGSGPDADSAFATGGAGVANGWGSKVSRFEAGAQGNVVHYFSDRGRTDDTYYNGRVHLNVDHEANRRLKLAGNVYGAYEYEPDYAVGASTGRLEEQYFYGFAHAEAAYQWAPRLSTVTGYTFSNVNYEDGDIGQTEDRMSHILSQEARYAFTRRTSGTLEYRYRFTDFSSIDADYFSHYALAGVNHAWSDRTNVGVKAGAEFRDSDRSGKSTSPYVEIALSHKMSRRTGIRWYNRLGLDDSDVSIYRDRYSYRTGIMASTQLTEKVTLHGGLHYVYSDLEGNEEVDGIKEHQGNATVGLSYSINETWAFNANYGFTTISSDNDARDYDRQRVTLGVTANF